MSENESMKTEGVKFDQDKNPFELVPYDSLEKIVAVYKMGAKKYEPFNWARGMKWGRVFGAIQRHLSAFWQGEDIDPESKLPHLAHAGWGILTLLNYMDTKPELDDRFKLEKFEDKDEIKLTHAIKDAKKDLLRLQELEEDGEDITLEFGPGSTISFPKGYDGEDMLREIVKEHIKEFPLEEQKKKQQEVVVKKYDEETENEISQFIEEAKEEMIRLQELNEESCMNIYLAGAYNETGYRETFKKLMINQNIYLFDPIVENDLNKMSNFDVVECDKIAIDNCDYFVAYVERFTAGTIMEIYHAYLKKKTIYLISSRLSMHNDMWLQQHYSKAFFTIEDCVNKIKSEIFKS